mmetsp:Transcript_47229/g.84506  ORF Transcript_47229/g.84506 Transcript_47229/m.84506 type:complete len:94 (+) Transcript_47229:3887-4168(+)
MVILSLMHMPDDTGSRCMGTFCQWPITYWLSKNEQCVEHADKMNHQRFHIYPPPLQVATGWLGARTECMISIAAVLTGNEPCGQNDLNALPPL